MKADFARTLAAEILAVQEFVALLKEEKEVLSGSRLEALDRIVAEKSRLAGKLEAIGKQRQAWLLHAGIEEKNDAIEQWLASLGDPRLLQGWKKLHALAQEAKALNELNGQCITLLAHNNQQLLDTLTGRAGKGIFYGPDGRTSGTGSFRIVDAV
ncbi:MAG: flagellar protein FlgN [Zoogloeaceae bacterium]|jgi:flagellar biosynthesis/type III secretory pathway chaperone|nr:flagellar protein FlgN [Zoogloeaceae bacterium]